MSAITLDVDSSRKRPQPDPIKKIAVSAVASLVGRSAIAPFELLQTRRQIHFPASPFSNVLMYSTPYHTAFNHAVTSVAGSGPTAAAPPPPIHPLNRTTIRRVEGGWSALWKGNGMNCMAVVGRITTERLIKVAAPKSWRESAMSGGGFNAFQFGWFATTNIGVSNTTHVTREYILCYACTAVLMSFCGFGLLLGGGGWVGPYAQTRALFYPLEVMATLRQIDPHVRGSMYIPFTASAEPNTTGKFPSVAETRKLVSFRCAHTHSLTTT